MRTVASDDSKRSISMKAKNIFIALLILLLASTSVFANGEQEKSEKVWPAKSIQIVVPYSPGGDTDYTAREYAKYLTDILGVPVVVTNVTGSGGAIGARKVLDANPDGYNVLWTHSAMLVSEAAGTFDKNVNDYELACIGARNNSIMLFASKASKYNTFQEVVAASNKNPNTITYAANTGATTYYVGATMNSQGAAFKLADFGGSSDRLAAMLGGQVDIIPNAYGMMKDYIDSGEVKVLANTGSERLSEVPNVPTLAELGFPDSTLDLYYFFAFPKGTPKEIVDKWSDAVRQVSEKQSYKDEIYKAYFFKPYYRNSSDALKEMTAQRDVIMKYKDLLKVN